MQEIRPLTALRGIMAFWVFCRHALHVYPEDTVNLVGGIPPAWAAPFVARGYLGVDGFFVLSGFILSYTYASSLIPPTLPRFRAFIGARVARIYPVYCTVLFLFVLLYFAGAFSALDGREGNIDFGLRSFVFNVFMLQSWRIDPMASWNDVAWSVSAEWFAYLFFPAFLLVIGGGSAFSYRRAAVQLAGAAAALAAIEAWHGGTLGIAGGLLRIVPEFAAGAVLFRIYGAMTESGHAPPRWLGLAALCVVLAGVESGLDVLVVAGLGALIFALAFPSAILASIMTLRVFVYAGRFSYSFYLVQKIPAYIGGRWGNLLVNPATIPPALLFLAYLAIVVCAAVALFELVEEPGRRRVRALLAAPRPIAFRKPVERTAD